MIWTNAAAQHAPPRPPNSVKRVPESHPQDSRRPGTAIYAAGVRADEAVVIFGGARRSRSGLGYG